MNKVFLCPTGDLMAGKPFYFINEETVLTHEEYVIIDSDTKLSASWSELIGYALFHGEQCLGFHPFEAIKKFGLIDLGEL